MIARNGKPLVDIEILKCLKDMDRSLLPQFAKTGRD
jgi:hypothetical protein